MSIKRRVKTLEVEAKPKQVVSNAVVIYALGDRDKIVKGGIIYLPDNGRSIKNGS